MNYEPARLTSEERQLIAASADRAAPQRRLRAVVVSGTALAVALLITSPLIQSWKFLLLFAIAYIALSTWERVRCARTIVAYRELVSKLTGSAGTGV